MSTRINLKPKTPKKTNSAIKKIIDELKITDSPVYLSLKKVEGSRARYCFNNCEEYVKNNNATIVYGWMFWEDRKKSFTEAEFHAVIEEDGILKDITPRIDDEPKILFVKDAHRDSGRKNPNSWYSWANIKMVDNEITENTHPLEIMELDHYHSEIIRL